MTTWKVNAFALATTLGIAYILCAIFDTLFPPYGFLSAHVTATPWPIYGSLVGFMTGFIMFTVIGFIFGALYGFFANFWSKKLAN